MQCTITIYLLLIDICIIIHIKVNISSKHIKLLKNKPLIRVKFNQKLNDMFYKKIAIMIHGYIALLFSLYIAEYALCLQLIAVRGIKC